MSSSCADPGRAARGFAFALCAFALLATGCAVVSAVGVKFLYRRADLPAAQVIRDLDYLPPVPGDHGAHRLDLYVPAGAHWPVIVFVHGGGWDSGDKQLHVGSADVYANIGRFYAANGIGVAVINYRLQPATDWRGQVADVRAAIRWAHEHVAGRGGRADALFLMGHSAGVHLAAFVALDSALAPALGIRGAIAVSGAGLDLADPQTYALGEDPRYYAKRFQGAEPGDGWQAAASPIRLVSAQSPPWLILHAGGEKPGLKRQARHFADALAAVGVEHSLVIVPGESHSRIVLTLSRPDKTAGPAILAFVRAHE